MSRKIAASILGVEDKAALINKLIEKEINWIHYDLMDGKFVENISLSVEEILTLVECSKEHIVDVHLMTEKPYEYISKLWKIADYISFHFEAVTDEEIRKILTEFKGKTNLGIVINPQTEVTKIMPYISQFDFVLVMSVVAGKGGQNFMPDTMYKVQEIKNFNPQMMVQMDGGINGDNVDLVFKNGVDVAVSGSYLIKNIDNESVIFHLIND